MSRDDEWIELEEAGLRLILFLPEEVAADSLADALAAGPFAGVVARGSVERIEALLPICRGAACALLVHGDVAVAQASGADGVHLAGSAVDEARARLGDRRVVGAEAHGSRHEAMVAGEAGADYVTFRAGDLDRLVDLVSWWSGISVLPCVAAGPLTPAMVLPLAQAGADLLMLGPELWAEPAGAPAMLRQLAGAVAAAETAIRNGR